MDKQRFYLKGIELCKPPTYEPQKIYKPFCKKHRQWPCKQCGTRHYKGCDCGLCAP